jgi:excinuclease ABC subunit C
MRNGGGNYDHLPEGVQRKLEALPAQAGVYVFRDRRGAVLYVGKAGSLRSRVRSYFLASNSDQRFFIATLQHELGDLETFVVGNAKEAALLENELIKEHQPRYNVKLRDDKDFLSLKLDPTEPWPRLRVVRRPRADGARYYGPYDSASSARATLRLVNRFFKLRTCKDTDFRSRARPCLQYQIKRCPAPCVRDVDRDAYGAQADLVGLFLDGRHDELLEDLDGRMRGAAADLNYELAATYRDQLRAVERVRSRQRIARVDESDQDVLGLHRAGDQVEVAVLEVRRGHLTGVRTFALGTSTLPDDELLSSFVGSYYGGGRAVPDELLLPLEVEMAEGLAAFLSEGRDRRLRIVVPKRGNKRRLIEMAQENAEHAFREKARATEDLDRRLGELQRKLRLPTVPRRIECIDVSHTGGTDTVAAITALANGEPDRARYRTFKVKRVRGGDDYGAMYEVLARRLKRGRDGDEGWDFPDLLVVDGGKGQLNVALTALRDLGVEGLPVVGLAKERENAKGEKADERVFLRGQKNAVVLGARSASRYLLAAVRDEAHRVSNDYRKKLGRRKKLRSGLDDVPGVGPKTRGKLLAALGSMKAVRAATFDELREAGASKRQTEAILRALHGSDAPTAADAERQALDAAFEELSP